MKITKVDNKWRINDSHSLFVGYITWIFGFTGSHRFYFGKPITGTLYALTFGVFGIGWLIDFFLIPGMEREADFKYPDGPLDYSLAWIFLTFLGYFGVHRFYIGKPISGIIWLLTLGLLGLGVFYDFWTLNEQVAKQQIEAKKALQSRA